MFPTAIPSCLSTGRKPMGYRLSLEVLATIPYAAPVPVRQLANEFRITLRACWKLVERLEDEFGLLVGSDDVVVPRGGTRAKIEATVLRYWRSVWDT